jgi:hypothetical protein
LCVIGMRGPLRGFDKERIIGYKNCGLTPRLIFLSSL